MITVYSIGEALIRRAAGASANARPQPLARSAKRTEDEGADAPSKDK